MSLTEKSTFDMGPEESGAKLPRTPREEFVTAVYTAVNEVTTDELGRLCREEDIIPSCKSGCYHCCRCHILTNIAEAHALTQYIRREFSADQRDSLRMRTQQWHQWDDARPGRYPSANIGQPTDLSNYDHCCPLVVNGACSAYPVRPMVCRTHFVSSPPLSCQAANDPDSPEDGLMMLRSVVTAAIPFSTAIRDHIENAGLDFSRSIMLLPQWLAIEMGWDFAISP